jgi:hypothetical protein
VNQASASPRLTRGGRDVGTHAMRGTIGRVLLGILGAATILGGILFLVGIRHLQSRAETVIVGVGAVTNGVVVLRVALGVR